jgi:hypothetical protein
MTAPILTYGSEIWTIKKIETAEIQFLRFVAGYTMKHQIRNTKIREEQNSFNPNNTILKGRA